MSIGKTRALVFTSLGHFINDGSVFFLPLIVDLLHYIKGVTPLQVSILLFLFYLSSTVAAVLVGRHADRTEAPGKLMAWGISFLGLGLIGFYFVVGYATGPYLFGGALLCDLVMGFGSSFYHPLGGSILQGAFRGSSPGRALGINGSMGSVGRALYPSLFYGAAVVVTTDGSLAVFGLVAIVAAFLIWSELGRFDRRGPGGGSVRPSIRSTLTRPMTILLGVSFLRSAALFGVAAYVPIFLTTQRGLGVGSFLGVALTAFYASAIFGQPLFGALTDRLDHRLVLAFPTAGAAGALVGAVYSSGIVSIAFLSLFGFFAYNGFPLLMSLASDYSTQTASALGNSIVWGVGGMGGNSVGPLLVYALTLNSYNQLGGAFVTMAAFATVAAIGALLIPKPTNSAAQPRPSGPA